MNKEIEDAMFRLTGPAEYASTYVLHTMPDALYADDLWEALMPIDTPLAALIRKLSWSPISCPCCYGTENNHAPNCELMALVRAINGGTP